MQWNSILALGSALCLSGCGAVVWTEGTGQPRNDVDGAVLSYALAQGLVSIDAELKSGVVTVTSDRKVTAVPDFTQLHRVVYSHNAFSDDTVEIRFADGALVSSISTTTADRTVDIVQGVTGLLTQVSATQSVLAKAAQARPLVDDKKADATCKDMKATYVKNVTYNIGVPYETQPGNCHFKFTVTANLLPGSIIGVRGFPTQTDDDPISICNYAFCFRQGAAFMIKTTVKVYQGGAPVSPPFPFPDFPVIAPVADSIGFVRFNRRAFVANETGITFGTNGVVSGFSAKNPSEVLGFIRLPTAVLAGVAAAALIK